VTGNASALSVRWSAPSVGSVDHYVVAARPVTGNFYNTRVRADASQMHASPTPTALGVDVATPYFVSVAAVDGQGHESLFGYPEYRCDSSGCVVPQAALNVTATQ